MQLPLRKYSWRWLLSGLFGFALSAFLFHEYCAFDPLLGYDAAGHILHLQYIANEGMLPTTSFYSSSNPPAYYLAGALIWKISHDIFAVQSLSLILFLLSVWLFYSALSERHLPWLVKWGLTAYFALLPLSLNYAVMIFNYVFVNFFALLLLLFLWKDSGRRSLGWRDAALIAAISSLAILSSLSGLAVWAVGFWFLLARPKVGAESRTKLLLIFALASFVILAPYLAYRAQAQGCIFCTLHRGGTPTRWYVPYNPRVYLHFDRTLFSEPVYVPGRPDLDGHLSYLYATWFGDYWNYLNTDGEKPAGGNVVTPSRKRDLVILLWLGLPIAIGSLWLVLRRLRFVMRSGGFFRGQAFYSGLPLVAGFLFYAQFFVYFHRYRETVLFHSGYLWPCLVLLCWIAAEDLPKISRGWRLSVSGYLIGFSLFSAWTFWF